jgi:hypothetical protein
VFKKDKERSMTMRGMLATVVIFIAATLPAAAVGDNPSAENEAVVIGRLTGTLHDPPRSFAGNTFTSGRDRGSVEFRGFRLVRHGDGGSFAIRPGRSGYFSQKLPPGEYDLVRKRRDRPSSAEDRQIRILTFVVPPGSLVNIGTMDIVLEGPPEETLYRSKSRQRGKYIYYYKYQRSRGKEAMSAPLEWYSGKNPDTLADFSHRIVTVEKEPAKHTDGSRLILREQHLPLIFLRKD